MITSHLRHPKAKRLRRPVRRRSRRAYSRHDAPSCRRRDCDCTRLTAQGKLGRSLNAAHPDPKHFTFAAYGQTLALHGATGTLVGTTAAFSLTALGYSGEHFDGKAQQQYLRARFYDPANGRFNRLDPFAGNVQDPQSLHKYAYVHADPVSNTDPSGQMSMANVMVTVNIIAFNTLQIGVAALPLIQSAMIWSAATAMAGMIGLFLEEAGVIPDTPVPEIAVLAGTVVFETGVLVWGLLMPFKGSVGQVRGPARIRDAYESNNWFRTNRGYTERPVDPSTLTVTGKANPRVEFVRVHSDGAETSTGYRSSESGAWIAPKDSVRGLTATQVRAHLSLPGPVTHVSDVDPNDVEIMASVAAPAFGQPGGGQQAFMLRPGATFSNKRPIPAEGI